MKPNLYLYLMIIILTIEGLSSCKDIIEPNISKNTVQLSSPGDKYLGNSYSINFLWNDVTDALTYRLQVVSPSFSNVGTVVLDTVVKTTKFFINLSPGSYEWRVKAQNSSYKTAYSDSRSFVVAASSIKMQKVQLLSPANGTLTNLGNIGFSWGELYGATKFRLEIDTNNFINEAAVLYNQSSPAHQINFSFPKDQAYQWRVRAENDTAQAQWSAINTIIYDHTPPAKVVLISPANKQSLSLPANLQWNTTTTATKYKLYVLKSDSITTYNSSFPLTTANTNYSFTLGSPGDKVYWKITAIDAAGNESVASELRSFVLQ